MRSAVTYILLVTLLGFGITVNAQDARALIKEGIQLNQEKQYTAAIEKYKAALALEPDNTTANYQIAVSLSVSGKGLDALPYLQKVVTEDASAAVLSSSFALMGNIYDKAAKPDKAIDSYLKAINTDTANYLLHYNLALAYFRAKKYNEAEKSVLNVLAKEPKHTGSLRVYALVTFHQNKRAPALLALCRLLSISPTGQSSGEAFGNLKSILKGGTLKADPGVKPPVVDAKNKELNQAIITAANNTGTGTQSNTAFLGKQLAAIFIKLGTIANKQTADNTFYDDLAEHFHQLALSDRMTAFANFISQSADKNAAAWVKAHPDLVAGEW
ncbi:tetratricopeptide repeat protein [Mucilaginibacter limnophilus]|uniref:Tetratricopeptide repeat protein n=1 Tax=Mucilaginibacter limnophilus TaxID=1932778 RepID=A0A3S2VQ89_9SPHI|nr:tetratricopeptide repeat protein [Mucilaginibacter limnophilus]RVU02874.1 tetratricopeptide repeat protein [Mucilaginibacter limnophilus]